jgi:hypothetical protein
MVPHGVFAPATTEQSEILVQEPDGLIRQVGELAHGKCRSCPRRLDQFRDGSSVGREHRHARCQCLERGKAKSLRRTRGDEQVGCR